MQTNPHQCISKFLLIKKKPVFRCNLKINLQFWNHVEFGFAYYRVHLATSQLDECCLNTTWNKFKDTDLFYPVFSWHCVLCQLSPSLLTCYTKMFPFVFCYFWLNYMTLDGRTSYQEHAKLNLASLICHWYHMPEILIYLFILVNNCCVLLIGFTFLRTCTNFSQYFF